MTDSEEMSAPSRLSRWDSLLLWGSLLAIIGLAWTYLALLADDMASMELAAMPSMQRWTMIDYLMMFIMWAVMMVGMMVPTAIRAVTIYSRIANKSQSSDNPVAATYWFILGYVLVWTGFSLFAAALQGVLTELSVLSSTMVSSSRYLGAGLLIAAGVYQFTPLKDACLRHCQMPAIYLAGRFGPTAGSGIRLGIGHGAYCLGCCWLFMSLLFVGGVMNLLWIALITGFVLLEKLLPLQYRLSRVSAIFMIIAGVGYFLTF